MSDHAEELADPQPPAPEPAAGSEPAVIVVPYRPGRTGVKFLPHPLQSPLREIANGFFHCVYVDFAL